MTLKRIPTLCFAIVIALIGIIGMLALLNWQSAQADSNTLFVSKIAGCFGSTPCYATLQDAVDAAQPGDEIRVASGHYWDFYTRPRRDTVSTGIVTQTVYLSKTLWIRGGFNNTYTTQDPEAYTTTLDAQGHGRGIYITGDISPTIEGFLIRDGDAAGMGGYYYYGNYDAGGGIYIITATATLSGNHLLENQAEHGGGIFLNRNNSLLDGNTISINKASNGGAGIGLFKSASLLTENEITFNTSYNMGGGIYLFDSDATLSGNTIANNTAVYGGGIDVASCNPILDSNVIAANSAHIGGGIELWYTHSTLSNNAIIDNSATVNGSGLYLGGSTPILLHTTVARNSGGYGSAIYVHSDGMTTYSTLAMTNTILVDHSIGISVTSGSSVILNGVLWQNTPITISQSGATVVVQNQYTGSPSFSGDGYHITAASHAIDLGVPTDVIKDIDGELRLCGSADLGADEYMLGNCLIHAYLPVIIR
jgi:parallel beta-helix repeat protein